MKPSFIKRFAIEEDEVTSYKPEDTQLLEVDKYIHDSRKNPPEEIYDALFDTYKETGVDKSHHPTEEELNEDSETSSSQEDESSDTSSEENPDELTLPDDPTIENNKEDDKKENDVGVDEDEIKASVKDKQKNDKNEDEALESFKRSPSLSQEHLSDWIFNGDHRSGEQHDVDERVDSLMRFGLDKAVITKDLMVGAMSKLAVGAVVVLGGTADIFIKTTRSLLAFINDKLNAYKRQQINIDKLLLDIDRLKGVTLKTPVVYTQDYTLSALMTAHVNDPLKAMKLVRVYAEHLFTQGKDNYKNNVYFIKRLNRLINNVDSENAEISFKLLPPLQGMKQEEETEDGYRYVWPELLPGNVQVIAMLPEETIALDEVARYAHAKVYLRNINEKMSFTKNNHVPSVDYLKRLLEETNKLNQLFLEQNNFVKEMTQFSKEGHRNMLDAFNLILHLQNQTYRKKIADGIDQYMNAVDHTNLTLFIKSHTYFENYLSDVLKYVNDCIKLIAKHSGNKEV